MISDLRNRMSQQDLEILELENKSKSSKDIKYEELQRVQKKTGGKLNYFGLFLIFGSLGIFRKK